MSGDNPLATTGKFYQNSTSARRANATSGAMYSGMGAGMQ